MRIKISLNLKQGYIAGERSIRKREQGELMKLAPLVGIAILTVAAACAQPLRLKGRQAPRRQPGIRMAARVGTHYILQFRKYPDAEIRAEIRRRGMRLLEYVPDNALLVAASAPRLEGLDLVSAGPEAIDDKISPQLDRQSAGSLLVEFHADVTPERARTLVSDLGFDVIENTWLMAAQLVISGPLVRLEALAAADEVKYILPAAPELAAGETMAGCAGALTEAGSVGDYVLIGNGWPRDASGSAAITYFIRSLTEKMDPSVARSEIERALREWTRYARVTISPAQQQGAERSIDISFAHGAHGDSYPFVPSGPSLAHTFYPAPPNSEPVAGDMHLNADEAWKTGAAVDLYSVALHEAGHALGLGHSDVPGAVMYPYYKLSTGLAADDIAAIQALYGSAGPSAPAPKPNPTPTPNPSPTPTPTPSGPDTTPPVIQLLSPGSTIVSTAAAAIAFSGTASDNVAVASVKWTNSTGDTGTAGGTASWSATIPLLLGTNVVTVRAYDAAGNSAWRSVTVVRH